MSKVVRNGKVAVVYSSGFGAGWYTWNKECKELLFHPQIVQAVMDGDVDKAVEVAKKICPDGYFGGADSLEIEWVEEGFEFEVEEYDGSERIHVIGERQYLVA